MNLDDEYLFDEEDEYSYYKNELNLDFTKDVYLSDSELNEADDEDNDEYNENNKIKEKNINKSKPINDINFKYNDKFFDKKKFNLNNIVDRPNTQFNCINKKKNKNSILKYI